MFAVLSDETPIYLRVEEHVEVLSFEQCFLFSSFPLLLAFVVGGLSFELCVFVAGWRHALRIEWPFIIIFKINNYIDSN